MPSTENPLTSAILPNSTKYTDMINWIKKILQGKMEHSSNFGMGIVINQIPLCENDKVLPWV